MRVKSHSARLFFRDVGDGAKCRLRLRQPAAGSGDADLRPAATRPPFRAPVAPPAVRLDCRAREIGVDGLYDNIRNKIGEVVAAAVH